MMCFQVLNEVLRLAATHVLPRRVTEEIHFKGMYACCSYFDKRLKCKMQDLVCMLGELWTSCKGPFFL